MELRIDPVTEFWIRFMTMYYGRSVLFFFFPELMHMVGGLVRDVWRRNDEV